MRVLSLRSVVRCVSSFPFFLMPLPPSLTHFSLFLFPLSLHFSTLFLSLSLRSCSLSLFLSFILCSLVHSSNTPSFGFAKLLFKSSNFQSFGLSAILSPRLDSAILYSALQHFHLFVHKLSRFLFPANLHVSI